MKRVNMLVLIAAVAVLAGCVQMESISVLNKDGSGTVRIDYNMSLDVEVALRELADMNAGMGEDMDDVQLFDESFDVAAMKKDLEPLGVKVTDYHSGVEDGRRVASLAFAFDNAEGLQAAMAFAASGQSSMGIRRLDNGNYALMGVEPLPSLDDEEEEDAAEPEMNMEDMSAAMENAGKSMELMGTLMSSISELQVVMKVTFPGDIIQQNAHRVEGRTCIWLYNSENMMQLENMEEPYIVFSGEGLSLDVPDR